MNIFSGFAVATTWEASKVNAVRDAWINDFMVIPIELFGLNFQSNTLAWSHSYQQGAAFLGALRSDCLDSFSMDLKTGHRDV
jgi:hypothetical protein